MEQVKRWQIVVFVAAIAAIGFAAFSMFRGRGLDLANSIVMVDVQTGELFRFPIDGKRGVGVPNYNPDSGALSLLPVEQDASGAWKLSRRARPMLRDLKVKADAVLNAETGEVRVKGAPRRITQKAAPNS